MRERCPQAKGLGLRTEARKAVDVTTAPHAYRTLPMHVLICSLVRLLKVSSTAFAPRRNEF